MNFPNKKNNIIFKMQIMNWLSRFNRFLQYLCYLDDFKYQFLNQLLIQINIMSQDSSKTTFIYQGTEYDASNYIQKHPGGRQFIDNMKAERKDFTEYFKALHSQTAQKVLKSFPIVSQGKASFQSQQYMTILQKINHLYKPNWMIQIILITLVAATFITGCFTKIGILSIFCFGFSQLLNGWMGHSMAHNRDPLLQQVGSVLSSLLGGFSIQWWSPKHNMHHMFTNSMLYDDDIKHNYKVMLYPFLYLKWRFDSYLTAISNRNYKQIVLISLNYMLLIYCRKNLIYFVIGQLISGFFSANVLIGNHEREKRYSGKIDSPFIDHQIVTSRNYRQDNYLWLILMGGMQFQTQHHLFPQIPFYNLPIAAPIIKQQLGKINRSVIYGSVL